MGARRPHRRWSTEIGDKLDVIMVPKVEGPWDIHYVDRLLAQLEAKAGLERPILVHAILETGLGRRQPRGDRHRQPAHAGHELRPGRPRRLAAHEDHARRRRPPRLPGDRATPTRTTPTRRAPTAQQDPWHYSIARMVDACTSAGHPAVLRARTATSATSRAARPSSAPRSCSAASAPGRCTRSRSTIAKKVFSPDPDEVAVRQEGARGDPRRPRRAHDRRQDAGRRHLEAVQGDGRRWPRCWPTRTPSWPRPTASRRRAGVESPACGSRPKPTTRCGRRSSSPAAPDEKPVKAERIATAQEIPLNFLENILGELRHAGIVRSHRGAEGGFRLAKPADEVTVADVIRAVEGPLASVRGGPPEEAAYAGAAEALPRVWIAVRANLRQRGRARDARRHRRREAAHGGRQAGRGPGGLGHALTRRGRPPARLRRRGGDVDDVAARQLELARSERA